MLGFVTISEHAGAADRLLSDAAATLAAQGLRLAGAVQDNLDRGPGQSCDMDLRILGDDGPSIRISQSLGPQAQSCRLDTDALTMAAGRAGVVLARGADLAIVNKFGKQESFGRGFRDFIAEALGQGVPVLLSVPAELLTEFRAFAGDLAEEISPDQALNWCRNQVQTAR